MLRVYFLIFIFVPFIGLAQETTAASGAEPEKAIATAKTPAQNNTVAALNRSIDFYNSGQYGSALRVLLSVKGGREQYPVWYYHYGLNLMRIQRYDLALKSFKLYIQKSQVSETAKAYYYTGLIQFYLEQYDQAINSLQLSLDVSTDPKLDTATEVLIDKTIRHQNYYESSKKTNLSFLLGYTYDTNTLNLARSAFDVDLAGHVMSYGVSLAHKVVDKYNFVFEPNVAVLDNYTLDSRLKANSTVQSADALQFLLSLPIRFFFDDEKNPNQFNFSLNTYSVYLPLTTSKRELSISSIYLKGDVLTPLNETQSLRYSATLASDKSSGHSADDDDATGIRLELTGSFYQQLDDSDSVYFKAGADMANTKGINTRYKKYRAGFGYLWPSWGNTVSNVGFDYFHLSYGERAIKRGDHQYALAYALSKNFSQSSSLSFVMEATQNTSNSDLNKYSDYSAGLQYSQSFGF